MSSPPLTREVNSLTGTAIGSYYVFVSVMGRYQANSIIIDGNSSAFDDDNNSDITLEHGQDLRSVSIAGRYYFPRLVHQKTLQKTTMTAIALAH